MINSETKDRLARCLTLLGVPGIGRGRYHRLVKQFGSPERVLSASLSELRDVPGLSGTLASAIKEKPDPKKAMEISARIVQLGLGVVFSGDSEYPLPLSTVDPPPPLLFRLGRATKPDEKMIAIVGTRHASVAYRKIAHSLAFELAKAGVTIVSGMAEGIDSAAHKGAIDAGGQTIAVWGTPLDQVYPAINIDLAKRIESNGTIYSEYPPGTAMSQSFFPERNRIISGLSAGVIVVQAGEKSGALITSKCALEQGRQVFAVPGTPGTTGVSGCNELIKKGARLVTSIQDIFDELPTLKGEIRAKRFQKIPDLTDIERKMVKLLSLGPLQLDQFSRQMGLSVAELLEFLLALELKGIIQEISGKRFILSETSQV